MFSSFYRPPYKLIGYWVTQNYAFKQTKQYLKLEYNNMGYSICPLLYSNTQILPTCTRQVMCIIKLSLTLTVLTNNDKIFPYFKFLLWYQLTYFCAIYIIYTYSSFFLIMDSDHNTYLISSQLKFSFKSYKHTFGVLTILQYLYMLGWYITRTFFSLNAVMQINWSRAGTNFLTFVIPVPPLHKNMLKLKLQQSY